jgi:hypothetical protein
MSSINRLNYFEPGTGRFRLVSFVCLIGYCATIERFIKNLTSEVGLGELSVLTAILLKNIARQVYLPIGLTKKDGEKR